MHDPRLVLANLQWAEIDYDVAKRHHMQEGSEASMRRALEAWRALERAREMFYRLAV